MTRTLTPVAERAKQLRKELKAQFPTVKFSVKTHNYSMGSSINVKWVDGATTAQVQEVTSKFERISRDTNGEILSGGNSFVMLNRDYSPEAVEQAAQKYAHWTNYQHLYPFSFNASPAGNDWEAHHELSVKIRRDLNEMNFTAVEAVEVEAVEEITVTENEEKDGVEIRFASKPSEEVRDRLKAKGFRWSRHSGCWYAKRTDDALIFAYRLEGGIPQPQEEEQPAPNNFLYLLDPLAKEVEVVEEKIEEQPAPLALPPAPTLEFTPSKPVLTRPVLNIMLTLQAIGQLTTDNLKDAIAAHAQYDSDLFSYSSLSSSQLEAFISAFGDTSYRFAETTEGVDILTGRPIVISYDETGNVQEYRQSFTVKKDGKLIRSEAIVRLGDRGYRPRFNIFGSPRTLADNSDVEAPEAWTINGAIANLSTAIAAKYGTSLPPIQAVG